MDSPLALRHTTALDQPTFGPHMDIDNAYGLNRSYVQTLRAYNRTPPKPTFYNEGYYEDTALNSSGVGAPEQMRAQAYGALLSGATGHIFGSDHVWMFGGPRGTANSPKPNRTGGLGWIASHRRRWLTSSNFLKDSHRINLSRPRSLGCHCRLRHIQKGRSDAGG